MPKDMIDKVIDEMMATDSDGNRFKIKPMFGAFGVKKAGRIWDVTLDGYKIFLDGEEVDHAELDHLLQYVDKIVDPPSVVKHGGVEIGDDEWGVLVGKKDYPDPDAALLAVKQNIAR